MKNIKALGLSALLLAGVVASSFAAKAAPREVPNDHQGKAIGHPLYGGYAHMRNSATGEMVVCSGKCLLSALILNTGPGTSKVTVRNTSVNDGSGAIVFVHRFTTSNSEPGNNPVRLPILLDKGISVTLSAASTEEEATALYLDLD